MARASGDDSVIHAREPAASASPIASAFEPVERWPCWLEVDLDAVAHNVRTFQAIAQPRLGVTAVAKARAYGLGAVEVARAAIEAGAVGVAVARVGEAALLRAHGVRGPMLLLGGLAPAEAERVVELDVTPTATDWPTVERLAAAAQRAGRRVGIQVKVDTGITRYGAPPEEAMAIVRGLKHVPSLHLDGFFTHFAAADDPDPFFAHQQLARYLAICSQLESEGFDLGVKHAANSAGAVRIPKGALDTVRVGIGLSGHRSTAWVPQPDGLRPAVALKARVVRFHTPAIGTSIGYGRTYKVFRPMRVALLSVGYADGLPRACSNRGHVLIRGRRCQLVGTVSMDMAMADVTHLTDVEAGDEAVLIGRQADEEITLDELADSAGIIPHEALVRLGSRPPRVYLRGGRPVRVALLSADRDLEL